MERLEDMMASTSTTATGTKEKRPTMEDLQQIKARLFALCVSLGYGNLVEAISNRS
jgi:hypothetical protein